MLKCTMELLEHTSRVFMDQLLHYMLVVLEITPPPYPWPIVCITSLGRHALSESIQLKYFELHYKGSMSGLRF